MKKSLLLVFVLLFVTGCASTKQKFLVDEDVDPIVSDLKIKSIFIHDNRKGVSDRKLNLPTFSWPGQHDQVKPRLTDEHETLIKTEINKYLSQNGPDVEIIVYIEDGTKEFNATWAGEKETVELSLKIDIHDGLHVPYLCSLTGNGFYTVTSWDASHDYIEKLYQKLIKSSIRKAFENLPEYVKEIEKQKSIQNIKTI